MVSEEGVKNLLNEYGEVIVVSDAGMKYELHGDVEFQDGTIHWDAGGEKYWLDADAIESAKIHKSHEMGGI